MAKKAAAMGGGFLAQKGGAVAPVVSTADAAAAARATGTAPAKSTLVQLNFRVAPDIADAFKAIASARGWTTIETFRRAVAALAEKEEV